MKNIDFFIAKCEELGDSKDAIVYKDQKFSYSWFAQRIKSWLNDFDEMGIEPGTVVAIESDFAPNTLALFMALIERRTILVPLLQNAPDQTKENIYGISQASKAFKFNDNDEFELVDTGNRDDHEYFNTLRQRGTPGLVLFSSGSTGQPKAAVHDFTLLLEKFRKPRPTIDMLSFLLFDA
jgi:acyl-CoA synthetase (AMP-forming)/AMP-acid ligase II